MRSELDLTCSQAYRQGERGVDAWYNAVQTQAALGKYSHKTAKFSTETYFDFFLRDEEFVSKAINDSNIDLNKFPASKTEATCQENGKLKSYCQTHKPSGQ